MNGHELARRSSATELKRKVREWAGPAGLFFQGFVEHPVMVGSIIPSSRYTIRRMLEPVDWSACDLFVEYGPGVGTFCRPVLDRLRRDADLIVIDTNPRFVDYLRRTIGDSRFHVVHGSAEDVEEIIRAHGHEQADYVLSGLPFTTLPEGVAPRIAEATWRVVRPGGAFLTYQFSNTARNYTAQHFPRVDDAWELRNVPPCKMAWGWKDAAA
jgi:phospholipid N-methyltransferase